VSRSVTGPEVFQRFRAIGLLEVRHPIAPENVEATRFVLEPFQNWMQTVPQSVRLKELCA